MNKTKDALEYYQNSRSIMVENQLERAVVSCTRAIKLDKSNPKYISVMVSAFSKQERYESAYSLCKSLLAMDPKNDLSYYNSGVILEKLGKVDESLEMYKKALDLDPDDSDGHYNLANILILQGKYEEAQKHYTRVLEIQPSDAYLVYNCIGYSYFIQGEFEKAIPELQKSISLNEKDPFAYCNMGLVLFCEDKSREALNYFEGGMKALEADQSPLKILKEIIRSYTNKKASFEIELNSSAGLDEERKTLLKTLIHVLTEVLNLLTKMIEK